MQPRLPGLENRAAVVSMLTQEDMSSHHHWVGKADLISGDLVISNAFPTCYDHTTFHQISVASSCEAG